MTRWLTVVAVLALAPVARAQSIVVSPNRSGGNPLQMSNSSFPGGGTTTVFPAGGTIQASSPTGIDQVNSGSLTGGHSFTVQNSAFTALLWQGAKGQDTNVQADYCYLTVTKPDSTHFFPTCNRTTIGNSDGPTNPFYSVIDLSPNFVDNVQFCTANTVTACTITACPAGTAKTQVTMIGMGPQAGNALQGGLTLASATSITLTAPVANTIAGVQVICWK